MATTKGAGRKKTASHELKQDIRNAVDALPGLLVNAQDRTNHSPMEDVQYYQEPKHATLLVGVGVTIVSAFILGLWVMNTRVAIADAFIHSPKNESSLLQAAQSEFASVIETIQQDTETNLPVISQEGTEAETKSDETQPNEADIQKALEAILANSQAQQDSTDIQE